ncbi:MAG: DUF6261 family protein [Cyclobacteriaceae bacterium]
MIKKLQVSYLRPAELTQTISNFLKAIDELDLEDPFIDRIVKLLEADNERLRQAITAVRINRLIDDVSEADALRDDLFIGFRDMLDACKRRKSNDILSAYQTVWPILEQAGTRLYSLGYTQQSGKMDAMFQELDKQENLDAIAALGLAELYTEMKEAQVAFSEIFNDRLDEDAKKSYPTLTDARKSAVPHVNALIQSIRILEESDPEAHVDLVNKMNAITTEIASIALSRKSKSEPDLVDEVEF